MSNLDLINAERKQWRENTILNSIAIQKLAKELDTVIKQKDELQEKLNNINKISIIENGKTNLADDQIKIK
jgi:hypothetical protein